MVLRDGFRLGNFLSLLSVYFLAHFDHGLLWLSLGASVILNDKGPYPHGFKSILAVFVCWLLHKGLLVVVFSTPLELGSPLVEGGLGLIIRHRRLKDREGAWLTRVHRLVEGLCELIQV
jgi:hypothetical protein